MACKQSTNVRKIKLGSIHQRILLQITNVNNVIDKGIFLTYGITYSINKDANELAPLTGHLSSMLTSDFMGAKSHFQAINRSHGEKQDDTKTTG